MYASEFSYNFFYNAITSEERAITNRAKKREGAEKTTTRTSG